MNSKQCPFCRAPLTRINATFCSSCGKPLPTPGSATQAINLGQQPQLLVQTAGQATRLFIVTKARIQIGRDTQNDLVINNPIISRQHAQIVQQGTDYWLTDLNSANGTTVNGRPLTPQQSHKLESGAIIRIGDQLGNSVSITYKDTASPARPSTIRLNHLNLGQLASYTIGRDPSNQVHLDHPSVSRRHAQVSRTPQGETLRDLGSANGTYVNGQRIKGVHLLIPSQVVQIGPYKLVYEQAGFTHQVVPDGNYQLEVQNLTRTVTIGGLTQRLFSQVTQKIILKDVTFSIQPREFVALVGGSGAGKSTLIKAMSGFTPATSGTVFVNGDNLYSSFDAYRSILGYVPQDDIIHGQLPVRSALDYAAQLRLPDASLGEIEGRIQRVLQEVEMAGHEEKLVSQLSGGQRKRVSIAAELLAEPGLFFLDEPTSGLDPGLEKKLMDTMRRMADGGRTIILVTHATSNIERCTHVAFLADGELAYFGPPPDALRFFEAKDYSDIYTRLSQTITTSAALPVQCQPSYQRILVANPGKPPPAAAVWADHYRQSLDYQQHVINRLQHNSPLPANPGGNQQKQTGQAVSMAKQFVVLARRYFELIQRDMQSLVILLAVMPLIGILLLFMAEREDLVGLESAEIRAHIQEKIDDARINHDPDWDDEQFQGVYQVVGSTQRVLFIVALAGSLLGLFAASYEIIKEEAIYQRERMVNLKIPPYLLSKMTVLALFAFIQCILFVIVLRLKLIFPESGIFLPAAAEFFVTLFLTTLASIAMGLLISAAVRSASTVIYVILVVLFVQILFAGAIFELPTAAKPISYMTTTRWSLEALGNTVNMLELRDKGGGCLEPEQDFPPGMAPEATEYCKRGQTTLPANYEFTVNYDHTAGHLLSRWLILVSFTIGLCSLTAFLQKRKDVIA